ncbi:hypothetical protein [Weissella minor]|uniref:hypothetical protein n=1 Tax=Weissella minor TaxID=1620 RepID=UPI003AF27D69
MNISDKQRLYNLRLELETIDELNWHGSGMIPEYARWYNVIGDEDAYGNWLLPAEFLGNNDNEIARIKRQREIVSIMRTYYPRDDNEEVHRTKEEQNALLDNVEWCKKFGLGNHDTAFVLGENINYVNKASSKLKKRGLQTAS